jgi:hypothetical protein
LIRSVETRDAIKECRFARTIRADDHNDLSFIYLEINPGKRHDPAEMDGKIVDVE